MQGKSLLVALTTLALCAADAHAATIDVKPGPNAIQKAVDSADPGDKLLVKRGTYREDVRVDKRLRIVGKKGKRPVIDGQCESSITVDVQANGVALRHLKVKGTSDEGAPGYTVNFIGIERGRARGLVVKESCPDAVPEYGINLFSTGAIQVIGNRTFGGYEDAGIYVGSITDTNGGTLRVNKNEAFGNNRGIIIEDVNGPGAKVLVRRNFAHHNRIGGVADTPTGIFLHSSDGSRFVQNRTLDNGDYGFHVDSGSDDNIFVGNRSQRNPDGNFFDEGSGNCGAGNSFSLAPC